ncbi:10605_t:CDS:2 [Scutellospora calospora]|uniref:10605_t:CDS:1 n=1 Tax=Scutellospora calospora TaxID=85575 RepID=A0ACA9N788_9GLOM|nr:10605_t:CDS:2 [Scutellospora calospora]
MTSTWKPFIYIHQERQKISCSGNNASVRCTFYPVGDFEYKTGVASVGSELVEDDSSVLERYHGVYRSNPGALSQRTIKLEKEYRSSKLPCNKEATYFLFGNSGLKKGSVIGNLIVDYEIHMSNKYIYKEKNVDGDDSDYSDS